MDIRHATPIDAREIEDLRIENWKIAYRGIVPDDYLEALSPKYDDREKSLRDVESKHYVAVDNNEIVGWVRGHRTQDDDCDEATYEIGAVYVKPSHWRQGIGKKLIDHLLGEVDHEHYQEVIVWTFRDYEQSNRFYQSLGFAKDEKTEQHTSGPMTVRLRKAFT
jgi:GNAT superfamily N-acetyltransferase